jgi:hypothetical protein
MICWRCRLELRRPTVPQGDPGRGEEDAEVPAVGRARATRRAWATTSTSIASITKKAVEDTFDKETADAIMERADRIEGQPMVRVGD